MNLLRSNLALAVLCLAMVGGCAASEDVGDALPDASGDVGGDLVDGADALPACEPAPAACDGNDAVTCVDGSQHRDACGTDAYCNAGACVPTTIVLPRDAGFHAERSEWWYYTGHVKDGDQTWGFEITIFQYDFEAMFGTNDYGYMCHVGLTDKTAGQHYHHDTITMDTGTWQNAPIVLEIDECRFEMGGDGNDHIRGIIPLNKEKDGKASPWTIDLTVSPTKRVARHGTDGIIPMSTGGGSSWYYSYTRLAASGTISTPEGDHAVTGQAWMDHQWGEFDITEFKGWDWWSLQFDDNSEIMLFQFTDWNGDLVLKAGTVVAADGTQTALEGMDGFTIAPRRTWASTHTDGIYPLDWDIAIPQGDWLLGVTTSVDDQEMYNPAQNYWEGETTVTGTRAGVAVPGVGYTELTGYASDFLDPVP
jgi:predicted secreted hydrolase